jgi:cytochrome c oxidase cbb3-type subunit I/II
MEPEKFYYDNKIVRNFGIATMFGHHRDDGWANHSHTTVPSCCQYGQSVHHIRARKPLHTNAVIFAFVGNAIFMGVYYSLQRLLKARMFSTALSQIHFWAGSLSSSRQ